MSFRLSWPNRITFARILLIPLFVLALIQAREGQPMFRWVALGLLILVCAGDALDGYLARRLHSRSRLGALLDPLADKLLMTSGYVLMATIFWPEPKIPKWVAVIVISRDVLMAIFYFALVALGTGFRQITPSFLGKLCTTLQMSTLVAVVSAPAVEWALGPASRWAFGGLFFTTAFLTLFTGVDYLYAARTQLGSPESVALIETDEE
jgi:cardiolipin synthase (CMP-forming)